MKENNTQENFYTAADVILKIIKIEGRIADDIEYPSEFQPAYLKLLEWDVIQIRKEEYIPGENFNSAFNRGFEGYVERKEQQRRLRNFAVKGLAGVIYATTGILWKDKWTKQPS